MRGRTPLLWLALCAALLSPEVAAAAPARPVALIRGGDVYVTTWLGGSAKRLTSTAAQEKSPSWLPGGTRIAFCRDGSTEVYWVDVATGRIGTYRLTPAECEENLQDFEVNSIAVSPNGSMVAVIGEGPSVDTGDGVYTQMRLAVFNLRTGASVFERFFLNADVMEVAWAGSNSKLCVSEYRGDSGRISTLSLGGTRLSAVPLPYGSAAGFSPDGRRVAWVQDKGDYGDAAHALRLSSSRGGTGTLLASGTRAGEIWWSPPSWTAGQSQVYFVASRGVYRVTPAGTGLRLIHPGATAVTVWKPKR